MSNMPNYVPKFGMANAYWPTFGPFEYYGETCYLEAAPSINAGGLMLRRERDDMPILTAYQADKFAKINCPAALEEYKEQNKVQIDAQRTAGRALAQIMADERKYR